MATFTKLHSDSIDPIDPIFKKTILQRRVGKNFSQVMWKTHCKLSQTLDWLELLLQRVAQPVTRFRGKLLFHLVPGRFGQLFYLNK